MPKKQEPYLGNEDETTPSWMRTKKQPMTFWTIAWAVCIGILLANFIEAITAAMMLYINMHVYLNPAAKKLLGL